MERKNIFDTDKPWRKKLTYYAVLGICMLVIGATGILSYRSLRDGVEEKTAPEISDSSPEIETEVKKEVTDVSEKSEKSPSNASETVKKDNAADSGQRPQGKEYIMPVSGEISVGFSLDTPVYSQTLKDWRIHDGIDISAPLGSNVTAVNDGVVEKIEADDMFGTVVTVKHTDGKKSVYANLEDSIKLEEGQIINRSDIIGKVAETALYEISDGPHLHFEMSEDGRKIDPLSVIKQD